MSKNLVKANYCLKLHKSSKVCSKSFSNPTFYCFNSVIEAWRALEIIGWAEKSDSEKHFTLTLLSKTFIQLSKCCNPFYIAVCLHTARPWKL